MLKTKQPKELDLVVLVSGRGSNLQAIIDAMDAGTLRSRIKMVISNKEEAFALKRAQKAGIPTQIIPSKGRKKSDYHAELSNTVQQLKPDLIVLAGYMKILPQSFVHHFQQKIINIHPSLLPSFKGLHAIAQAMQSGTKYTGCTVHFVDAGVDTGPIILQSVIPILDQDTEESLAERLLPHEHQTLVKAINLLEDDKVVLQGRKTLLR